MSKYPKRKLDLGPEPPPDPSAERENSKSDMREILRLFRNCVSETLSEMKEAESCVALRMTGLSYQKIELQERGGRALLRRFERRVARHVEDLIDERLETLVLGFLYSSPLKVRPHSRPMLLTVRAFLSRWKLLEEFVETWRCDDDSSMGDGI